MKLVLGIAVAILFFGVVGTGDYEEAQSAHQHYCDMVSKWASSGGEYGHPNYDDRDC